jgi:adenylylsulfate reductase subunit A
VAKSAVKFIVENNTMPNVDQALIDGLKEEILKPLDLFEQNKGYSSDADINPNYCKPKQFMFRLQKIMDEYVAGVSSQFKTNKHLLEKGLELLTFLKEDSVNLAAENHHELMRCWENIHRMWQAESHLRTVMFREETRWPGYYFRADFPTIDENNWKCFVNCRWDPKTGDWDVFKKPIINIVKQ